jgi:hypothetical protein
MYVLNAPNLRSKIEDGKWNIYDSRLKIEGIEM